jgi:hypothetical protein
MLLGQHPPNEANTTTTMVRPNDPLKETNIDKTKKNNKQKMININKPQRPLNAYNLFFRYQRTRLMEVEQDQFVNRNNDITKITVDDVAQISSKPRYGNGTKRQHRKNIENTNPMMNCHELTHHVATQWKSLPWRIKGLFEQRAAQEKEIYQQELKIWTASSQQAQQSRQPVPIVSSSMNDTEHVNTVVDTIPNHVMIRSSSPIHPCSEEEVLVVKEESVLRPRMISSSSIGTVPSDSLDGNLKNKIHSEPDRKMLTSSSLHHPDPMIVTAHTRATVVRGSSSDNSTVDSSSKDEFHTEDWNSNNPSATTMDPPTTYPSFHCNMIHPLPNACCNPNDDTNSELDDPYYVSDDVYQPNTDPSDPYDGLKNSCFQDIKQEDNFMIHTPTNLTACPIPRNIMINKKHCGNGVLSSSRSQGCYSSFMDRQQPMSHTIDPYACHTKMKNNLNNVLLYNRFSTYQPSEVTYDDDESCCYDHPNDITIPRHNNVIMHNNVNMVPNDYRLSFGTGPEDIMIKNRNHWVENMKCMMNNKNSFLQNSNNHKNLKQLWINQQLNPNMHFHHDNSIDDKNSYLTENNDNNNNHCRVPNKSFSYMGLYRF